MAEKATLSHSWEKRTRLPFQCSRSMIPVTVETTNRTMVTGVTIWREMVEVMDGMAVGSRVERNAAKVKPDCNRLMSRAAAERYRL